MFTEITNDEEHALAMSKVQQLMDETAALAIVIETYEKTRWPIFDTDGVTND